MKIVRAWGYLFFLLIGIATGSLQLFGNEFSEVDAVLEKVLAGRNKMVSGHFILEVNEHVSKIQGPLQPKEEPTYTLDIYFQKDKVRIERKRGLTHLFSLQNCYMPESIVHFNVAPFSPLDPSHKHEQYIVVGPSDFKKVNFDKNPMMVDTRNYFLPDVRGLGVVLNSVESAASHPLAPNFQTKKTNGNVPVNATIELVEYEGEKLLKIYYEYKFFFTENGKLSVHPTDHVETSSNTCWVDPDKDYIVRHAKFTYTYQNGKTSDSMVNNQVVQDKKSGVWYPNFWVFEFRSGDQIMDHEECTLTAVSINEPIDEKMFSLEGIKELKPGTYVHWQIDAPPPEKPPLAWDGKKITSKGTVDFEIATQGLESQKNSKRRNFIILINAILISGILASLFYRAWRKKRG